MNIVRTLLLLALIIFMIQPEIENEVQAQDLGIGVSAGMNFSSHLKNFRFQGSDFQLDFNPSVSAGYQGGMIFRQGLTERFRLQFEPTVILLGAKYDDSFNLRGFEFQSDSRTELTYFQLPVVLQLTTIPPERTVYGLQHRETTYHLSGGFFAGYLMNARFSGTNSGAPVGVEFSGDFSNDVIEQYSEYDGGLILGGGLEHGLHTKIGLEARILFSIVDSGNAPELNFKPQNLGVSLSVYFLI